MTVVLRPLPVVFACRGCPEHGYKARDVAAVLERRSSAETVWLGAELGDEGPVVSKARSRYPIVALDGCGELCAQRWLAGYGVKPQRHVVLPGSVESAEQLAGKIFP